MTPLRMRRQRPTANGADRSPRSLTYRFFLPAACGFWLAKRQLFPLAAARGSGQLILNVLLPALLFNKVVQSIDSDNVSALGPIVLVGAFYELLGLALAWLVRLLLPVPRNFRNGLLVAGMIGNWVGPRLWSRLDYVVLDAFYWFRSCLVGRPALRSSADGHCCSSFQSVHGSGSRASLRVCLHGHLHDNNISARRYRPARERLQGAFRWQAHPSSSRSLPFPYASSWEEDVCRRTTKTSKYKFMQGRQPYHA